MNIRHLQGWSLISSALARSLLLFFKFSSLARGFPYVTEILIIVSCICFIVGLFGIYAVQPQTKLWGKIGLILMLIPTLRELITVITILFVENPLEFNQRVDSFWQPLTAVGIIYSGYIIVGWLTVQARVFPAWVGWLLFIVGIFYDIILFFVFYGIADSVPFSVFLNSLVFLGLLEVVVFIGYGVNIIKYKVPRKKRTQHR